MTILIGLWFAGVLVGASAVIVLSTVLAYFVGRNLARAEDARRIERAMEEN